MGLDISRRIPPPSSSLRPFLHATPRSVENDAEIDCVFLGGFFFLISASIKGLGKFSIFLKSFYLFFFLEVWFRVYYRIKSRLLSFGGGKFSTTLKADFSSSTFVTLGSKGSKIGGGSSKDGRFQRDRSIFFKDGL